MGAENTLLTVHSHWDQWLVSAAYGPPAAGDSIVAIVLVVALHRSHTGIKRYMHLTLMTLFEKAYMSYIAGPMLY